MHIYKDETFMKENELTKENASGLQIPSLNRFSPSPKDERTFLSPLLSPFLLPPLLPPPILASQPPLVLIPLPFVLLFIPPYFVFDAKQRETVLQRASLHYHCCLHLQ